MWIFFPRFDVFDLCRFTLTCRKNYRRVPYHNWYHAFNVTQSMYYIIKNSPGAFDRLEVRYDLICNITEPYIIT